LEFIGAFDNFDLLVYSPAISRKLILSWPFYRPKMPYSSYLEAVSWLNKVACNL